MKSKLLYIAPSLSSFVKKDLELLEQDFEIEFRLFKVKEKWMLPFILLKEFLSLSFSNYHGIIIMFAGYHSFIPVFLQKIKKWKTFIIAGGTDCVSFPSIKYGYFQNKLIFPFINYSFKNCSLILPVHEALIFQNYNYCEEGKPAQGIKAFLKDIQTPFETIHNGYDAGLFKLGLEKNKLSAVTIGADLSLPFSVKLKGIDLFIELAEMFPEVNFYIVGGKDKIQIKNNTKNLILTSFIPNQELPAFLSDKGYYFQLSLSEGFPNALSEAMLCGCIPVVANTGGMPDIVNNSGYILKERNLNQLAVLFKKALEEYQYSQHELARKRITENYTKEKRQKKLKDTIQKVLNTQ